MRSWQRWLVLMVFSTGLCGCGGGDAKKENAAPAQPAPVAPAPIVQQRPPAAASGSERTGGFQDLLQYLPENLKIAAGANFASLNDKANAVGPRLLAQFQPATIALGRGGIKADQIERLWTGNNRETGDLLFCVRTKSAYDAAAVKKGLAVTEATEKIGKATVHHLPTHGAYKNAVALIDPKTLLIGRYDTLSAALKNPKPGAVRAGIDAVEQPDSFYWIAGDDSMARMWMGGTGAGGGGAADFVGAVFGDTSKMRAMGIGFGGTNRSPAPTPGAAMPAAAAAMLQNVELAMGMCFASEAVATSVETKINQSLKGGGPNAAAGGAQPAARFRRRAEADFQGRSLISSPGDEDDPPAAGRPGPNAGGAATFGPASVGLQIQRAKENVRIGMLIPAMGVAFLSRFINDATSATGSSALPDGIFDGTLAQLAAGLREWPMTRPETLKGVRRIDEQRLKMGYSWMTELLPFVGQQGLYELFDFNKSWSAPENFLFPMTVIPAFLNPADPRATWEGFPDNGLALTHFVGMSGIEDGRNVVAAELPRSDPRAGIFGYGEIAKLTDISDGASQTIMMIGSGEVAAPWVQGGGATIRGARAPYFNKYTGFGSRGLAQPGAYVLFADGSARSISADIDPSVFKALCTMHGAEQIDMSKLAAPGQE